MFPSPYTSSEQSPPPDTTSPFQSDDALPSSVCENDLVDIGLWSQYLAQEISDDELHAIIHDPSSLAAASSVVTSSEANNPYASPALSDFSVFSMSEAGHSGGGYSPCGFKDDQPNTASARNSQSDPDAAKKAPAKKTFRERNSTNTVRESIVTPSKITKPPAPKIHGCTICEKKFARSRDARRHEDSVHHHNKNIVCAACGMGFARQDTLNRHQRSKTACKGVLTWQDLYRNSRSFRQNDAATGPSTSTQ
ncbi:hypothetical protein BJV82DRAFT_675027 [Fennellomyces sp. T-0311]|nr:hypothetical protein BJV82DRAFT_675027 [Fennellomyces sp. T-0311]